MKKHVLSKIEEIYIRSDINKIYINQDINFSDQEKRSIIRGTFLGGGTFNNPNNTYYIEMILSTYENAEYIHKLLIEYNILTKFLVRKKGFSVYTKSAEEISKILALMGSNKAVLNFEEIRVVKETRNNVNRIINCETANLNKIVNASVKQIEDIKYLKEKNEFKYLPDSLKEIAEVRLKNPEMSLIELGEQLEKKIGKSGVKHRLKKISEIATELRKKK